MAHQAAEDAGRRRSRQVPAPPATETQRSAVRWPRERRRPAVAGGPCSGPSGAGVSRSCRAHGDASGVLVLAEPSVTVALAAHEPTAEGLELVGGDLAVVHQAGHLAQRAVRGQLVELLLGDDAVREEALELLAVGLRLLPGGLAGLLAGLAPAVRSALTASRIAVFWAAVMVPLATRSSRTSERTVSVFAGLTVVPGRGVGVGEAAAGRLRLRRRTGCRTSRGRHRRAHDEQAARAG